MTELGSILTRLGLEGYLPAFLEEGFDTWETVLDITENDLYGNVLPFDTCADRPTERLCT